MQQAVRTALQECATWAVVGCSPDPLRDSHRIAALLQRRGKRVIPINPHAREILGERCYPFLLDVPAGTRVDVVDIFRRADEAGAHVDEAIAIGARAVWMQLGVVDHGAAARAIEAGLLVVMDRCPAIEWPRLSAAWRSRSEMFWVGGLNPVEYSRWRFASPGVLRRLVRTLRAGSREEERSASKTAERPSHAKAALRLGSPRPADLTDRACAWFDRSPVHDMRVVLTARPGRTEDPSVVHAFGWPSAS